MKLSQNIFTACILSFYVLFGFHDLYAANIDENTEDTALIIQEDLSQSILENYEIDYKDEVYIEDEYTISLTPLIDELKKSTTDSEIRFSWDIFGESPQNGESLNIIFSTPGRKQISLNIYEKKADEGEERLIFSRTFIPLVYSFSIPLLYDSSGDEDMLNNYKIMAADSGVFLYNLGKYEEKNIDGINIEKSLSDFYTEYKGNSNYILFWGEKEFLFSSLSQFELQMGAKNKYNFVLMSSYNKALLQNYIENSIAGKNIISEAIVIDDIAKSQILKYPDFIGSLTTSLDISSYEYRIINTNIEISPILFISQFIKELSVSGVKNSDIYIVLLIPFFLTLVAIAKHVIGISSLGNTIPVFLSIMFFKIGIIFTLIIVLFLFLFNIILSRFLNKYTLLYTPKINCMTIANIIFFMLFYSVLQYTQFIDFRLDGIIYIVLLFLVSEKMISIITTKEYREYKKSIWGTFVIAGAGYGLFYIDTFLVFLFSYPEIILLLIPFNFFLGGFTGLRITEYFRFHEIIKTHEEEE